MLICYTLLILLFVSQLLFLLVFFFAVRKELAMLRNLEELALGGLNFKGPIPPAIGSLTSLKILDLSSNGHNDSQSIQGMRRLLISNTY